MTCANCGAHAKPTAHFCDHCGVKLSPPLERPATRRPTYADIVLWENGADPFYKRITREGALTVIGVVFLLFVWLLAPTSAPSPDASLADSNLKQTPSVQPKRNRTNATARETEATKQKKAQVKTLVEEFVSGLPSLEGQMELIVVGMTNYGAITCNGPTHSHHITWLNPDKTRAKVSITRHCDYAYDMDSRGFRSVTKDYKGGSFTCEQVADGTWRIMDRN